MSSSLAFGLIASTLLCLLFQDLGVTASGLVALTPKYQEVPSGGTLTVLFKSQDGLPITECGFKVDAPLNTAEDSISWTSSSTNTLWRPKTPKGSKPFQGKYFGKGLDAGECGVQLSNVLKLELIGVLVVQDLRVELDFFTVYGYNLPTLKLEVQPSFQTVPVGSNVDITCINEGKKHINGCTFRLPNTVKRANFHNGDDSDSTDRYQYQGRGLKRGQCGIRLLNVTEADSGWYVCSALLLENGVPTHLGNRQSVLLVTGEKSSNGESQEPKHKIKVIVNETVFDVGNTMVATCTITGPYPLPDTVWLLGEKMLPPKDSSLKALRNAWLWEEQCWTLELNTEVGMQLNDLPLRCEIRKNVGCQANQVHVADHKIIKVKPNCGFRIEVEYDSTAACKSPKELLKESTYVDDIDKVVDQSKTFRSKRNFEGYPWHAGIYKFKESTSSTRSADGKIHNLYSHICGGTLITKRHVLTAAHCFGEKVQRDVNAKYKVALGKFYRDYGQFDCRVQWRDIVMKQVHIHPQFVGLKQGLMFDIAVIDLRQHAVLSTRVGLACVDWEYQYKDELLKSGNSGWLSGWGYTSKDGDFSSTLRTLALPYKDTNECIDLVDKEVLYLLTSDKFCAGFHKHNISACPGDSGGGLLFNHTKLGVYYVSGVTSSSFRPANFLSKCYTDEVTSFTRVYDYIPWLKEVVSWGNKTALYSLFYKQPPMRNFTRTKPRREPAIIVWEKP